MQASRGQLAEMGADKRWVTFHDGAICSIKRVSGVFVSAVTYLFAACVREYRNSILSFCSYDHMLMVTALPPKKMQTSHRRGHKPFMRTSWRRCVLSPLGRISRTERSGRYGSDQSRDDSDWRDRRERDQERDSMRRWGDERRNDRFDDRRGSRDSPEVGPPPTPSPGRHRIESNENRNKECAKCFH